MAAKKTFKIGEYCKGGIISVEIQGKIITVIGKEMSGKEFTRGTAESDDPGVRRKLFMFISDLTSAYYTDKVIDWIATKVEIPKGFY